MLSPLANVAGFYKLSLNNEVKVHKHYIFYYVLPISAGLRTGKNWEKNIMIFQMTVVLSICWIK